MYLAMVQFICNFTLIDQHTLDHEYEHLTLKHVNEHLISSARKWTKGLYLITTIFNN